MTPTLRFDPLTVRLVQDDIANRGADALVNAANDRLMMGGGVAAALRSRGGIEIHQEAIRHAPAPIGSVVRTGAGARVRPSRLSTNKGRWEPPAHSASVAKAASIRGFAWEPPAGAGRRGS